MFLFTGLEMKDRISSLRINYLEINILSIAFNLVFAWQDN